MTALDSRVLLENTDGSLGPLLRIADDRLGPGTGYGVHEHRAVDVVAVVLAGSLRHRWGDGAELVAGDVAVLRAGDGLAHDEVAGDGGARVLQCYLRTAAPGDPPAHEVVAAAAGWVELGRPDAQLWIGTGPGPGGLRIGVGQEPATVDGTDGGACVVWRLDAGRPSWAE
ncbi:pirin family protein [Blastococcus sp. URHD0036]|uniref:pirin family protein n=1 Tax=Blastococcus sp. URHD0036 TaxID=1380356 RepID=UPI0004974E3F|nr:pirin family protein [Blastococcus sp. URHD0036]